MMRKHRAKPGKKNRRDENGGAENRARFEPARIFRQPRIGVARIQGGNATHFLPSGRYLNGTDAKQSKLVIQPDSPHQRNIKTKAQRQNLSVYSDETVNIRMFVDPKVKVKPTTFR